MESSTRGSKSTQNPQGTDHAPFMKFQRSTKSNKSSSSMFRNPTGIVMEGEGLKADSSIVHSDFFNGFTDDFDKSDCLEK